MEKKSSEDCEKRREALKQIGKFAAYAAPFTLLLVTERPARGYRKQHDDNNEEDN
jgi:hypothetical protein